MIRTQRKRWFGVLTLNALIATSACTPDQQENSSFIGNASPQPNGGGQGGLGSPGNPGTARHPIDCNSAYAKPCGTFCIDHRYPEDGCAEDGCEPCPDIPPTTAFAVCKDSGKCGYECRYGYADCNHDAGDLCETFVLNDDKHCGSCDAFCSDGTCSSGICMRPPKH